MSKTRAKPIPLTREQQWLIEDYLAQYEQQMYKCIHKTANKQLDDEEFEELRGAAYEGLCKAAKNFNPNKSMAFASFAYLNVSSMVKNILRADNSLNRILNKLTKSLDEPLDDTDRLFIKDVVVGDDGIEVYETSLRIVQYLHKIPTKAKQILRLRYINGWDYMKIKESMELSDKEMKEMLIRLQTHDNVKILRRDERINGYKN